MKNKTSIFLASLIFLLALGSFEQVLACFCLYEPTAEEAYDSANAVFVGKVISGKEQKKSIVGGKEETYDVGEIYFEVEEAFKGAEKGKRVTIHSGTTGIDCGYWFKRGETYLVYARYEEKDILGTNICSGTLEISDAKKDLEFLRRAPTEKPSAKLVERIDSIADFGKFSCSMIF